MFFEFFFWIFFLIFFLKIFFLKNFFRNFFFGKFGMVEMTVEVTVKVTQGPARVGFWSSRSEKWKKEAVTLYWEVQSENKMLSLFFEKCKVKKKCFHSFSRSAKWKTNAFTLFREVKSEIKMLWDRDLEVKILKIS